MRNPRRSFLLDASVIVLTAAIAAGAAWWLVHVTPPSYRAVARVLVVPNHDAFDERDLVYTLDTLTRPAIMATFGEIMNSEHVQEATRIDLGLPAATDAYEFDATAVPGANLIEIAVLGPSPRSAADFANTAARQGSSYLQERYGMFRFDLLDDAVPPEEAFSPRPVRDVSLALALGIGFGIVLVAFSNAFGRSARRPEPKRSAHTPRHSAVES